MKLVKNPIIYFFVLGFVVFGLHAFLNMEKEAITDDPFTVDVTSADIEWLRSSWEGRMQRKPSPEELRGLVDSFIREEILAREAYTMGLDEQDQVIKRRLVQKLTFVFEDLAESVEPADETLIEYAEANQDKYRIPETISFTQVYFNPDDHSDVVAVAEGVLARAKTGNVSVADAVAMGDAIMLDSSYDELSVQRVAGVFGPSFAEVLFAIDGTGWCGPIASSFGLHIVHINNRTESRLPDFESIRERVRYDYMYDQKKKVIDHLYGSVKSRYTILVEGLPYE
ncbi:MAG: peptidyl-prolyl cis-trans isomerase [Candidatus Latescibacterota bacterium]|nr:MAG: peptidyl-prolyl cis-trans isomerase [Candidatus Latescibacterota bacterium]